MKIMDNLNFESYEEFAESIDCTLGDLREYESVGILAKYDEAKKIIEELVCIGNGIYDVNICSPEYNDYKDEYLIAIDNEYGIWCEPFKNNGRYYDAENEFMYVMDNCSSAVFSHCDGCNIVFEVAIDEDYYGDADEFDKDIESAECDHDCENCEHCDDDYKVLSIRVPKSMTKDDATECLCDMITSMEMMERHLAHSQAMFDRLFRW